MNLIGRRIDDDKGRTYELEQSAVKCMRGILFCYMRQSHKVSSLLEFMKLRKCRATGNSCLCAQTV
jgi:phosphorylase kinase alpha/beta subunit